MMLDLSKRKEVRNHASEQHEPSIITFMNHDKKNLRISVVVLDSIHCIELTDCMGFGGKILIFECVLVLDSYCTSKKKYDELIA